MQEDRSLQRISRREALKSALIQPGIAAFGLGVVAAVMVLLVTSQPLVAKVPTSFLGYPVTMQDLGRLCAVAFFVLSPLMFIPFSYRDLRKNFVRCLECGKQRSLHAIEHLRAMRRCGTCHHELPPQLRSQPRTGEKLSTNQLILRYLRALNR
ncbi:hypothetical protein C4552_02340 [Candidatus Parcubacteria bacterium]|nr:MAG: hypothetical protein C4552_02340 [Candidatus Parcubacteria bacterium]